MPETDIRVLVVVVTYNGCYWINDCLGSLRQSDTPLDVVIIDNQSTDDTVTIIKEHFPEMQLIESQENLGFGRANNLGLKKALEEEYDYTFLLNQDAWIKPSTIKTLVDIQQCYPQYGILSPVHLNRRETSLDKSFANYLLEADSLSLMSDLLLPYLSPQRVYTVKFVNAAAWLISKKCLQMVGGFDPLFPHYGEDQDYVQRAIYYGFEVGFTPNTYIIHDREGYTKINDMHRSLARQYKDNLVLLKNVHRSFITNLYIAVRNEVYNVLVALYALDGSQVVVKLRLLYKIISKAEAVRRSWKYCTNTNSAYL